MGTMGPVSEEPGLSLWDAMSVLCPAPAGRGGGGRRLGGPGVGAGGTLTIQSEIRFDLEKEKERISNNSHFNPSGGERARPGAWPTLRPQGGRGPGGGHRGQPSPPRTVTSRPSLAA